MALDIEALRADTPGCEHLAHFNNAGSSLPPIPVLDRVITHLQTEARVGGYEAQADAAEELDGVYDALATLIGARPRNIAVVENATRGWDMAFYALARRRRSLWARPASLGTARDHCYLEPSLASGL